MPHASDQRKQWALRVSNPRPSPCKGEEELLVRGLSRHFACHRSALVYHRVTLSCYAKCYASTTTEAASLEASECSSVRRLMDDITQERGPGSRQSSGVSGSPACSRILGMKSRPLSSPDSLHDVRGLRPR
jgi:hypothetical protein